MTPSSLFSSITSLSIYHARFETTTLFSLFQPILNMSLKDQKLTYLDGVCLNNQIDFIGFGVFSRKKMEEALPGEKIIKFGW